jgi:hypothetical protein
MISTPQERLLILIWEQDAGKWVIAESHPQTRRDVARRQLALYRQELGNGRARLIHTADGE